MTHDRFTQLCVVFEDNNVTVINHNRCHLSRNVISWNDLTFVIVIG